jgi:pyruvate-ferredoxin/flavodoxin oxidoreductase
MRSGLTIIDKELKFFVIDGVKLGNQIGLGPRINVIMQTAFFKISNIITVEQAVREIKDAIVKSYSKAGEKVLNMNNQAVDVALENIQEVTVPASADSAIEMTIGQWNGTPDTVKNSLGPIIDGLGDSLPVSAMPVDGTFPTGTAMYEKRNIAIETPVWDEGLCIQCGICSFVCPHASIRMKIYDDKDLSGAPETFKSCAARRLHRLWRLRPQLSGKKQNQRKPQSDQHAAPASIARYGAKKFRFLPRPARYRSGAL